MQQNNKNILFVLPTVLLFILTIFPLSTALADGDETLGPPSIGIASGSGMVAAGVGLSDTQPGVISIDVPTDATIKQVLLYWQGHTSDVPPDDDVEVEIDGDPGDPEVVTGTLIGTTIVPNVANFPPGYTFRADITGLNLIIPGSNFLSVGGLDYEAVTDGAGLLVIYQVGSEAAEIEIRDGSDFAFIDRTEPKLKSTVKQTFEFTPVPFDRTATLPMFFCQVAGDFSRGIFRPSSIEITIDGVLQPLISNVLNSVDGEEWDTLNLEITIPAGASELSVQAFSRDDLDSVDREASLFWLCAGISIETPTVPDACRMTGGNATIVPAIGLDVKRVTRKDMRDSRFWITTGGQINAPSGHQPPRGHWTHSQHGGAEGNFTFHSGTSSAPAGTEISTVDCADPGWCVQARCAPFKQIFWTGIGNFANQHFDGVFESCEVIPGGIRKGGTLHYYKAMVGDFGENRRPVREASLIDDDPDTCNWFDKLQFAGYDGPPGPFDAEDAVFLDSEPDDKFGDKGGQVCDMCPDYYQIEIHCNADPTSEVIYTFEGFLDSGNYQIHPETGIQCP